MIICYASIMGRYPHDLIYSFSSFLLPALLLPRYLQYYMNGWHFFLIDFCYFVNCCIIYFLMWNSQSQVMFITCFVYSNGPVALAIVAFRNSLVYHKIDYLTSLAIHAIPMTIMTHIRWYTIPEQSHLPEEKQRFPISIPEPKSTTEFLSMFIGTPFKIYFVYLICYGLLNFVISAKTIREKNYFTTYTYFSGVDWIKKVLSSFGNAFAPLVFMFFCALYVFLGILAASACFWSYHLNMLTNVLFLLWSFFNGASYYMETFSRKYEK